MSVVYLADDRQVVAMFDAIRPRMARKIPVPVVVNPKTTHYALVGMAFDYLLRFELNRRAPHAMSTRWFADHLPDLLWKSTPVDGGITIHGSYFDNNQLVGPSLKREPISSV